MGEQELLDALLNPSITHWLAMALGQWVYALTGGDHAIVSPVSALMVVLAALTVIAILSVIVLIFFLGGRAIFSSGVTASVVANGSPYIVVRVLTAVALILPSSYGLSELDEYKVSISNGQVGVVRAGLWGGAAGDVMWGLTGSSLVKYNVVADTSIHNTVSKSEAFAKAFTCNEFFYKTVGEANGLSRFYFRHAASPSAIMGEHPVYTGEVSTALQQANSWSDISLLPGDTTHSGSTTVFLGGAKGDCGTLSIPHLSHAAMSSNGLLGAFKSDLYDAVDEVKSHSFNAAAQRYFSHLGIYDDFARRYYNQFSDVNYTNILSSQTARAEEYVVQVDQTNNVGALQGSSASDLSSRVASATDAMIYLTLSLSYVEKSISRDVSDLILVKIMGVKSEAETSHSPQSFSGSVFNRFMSGYVSAGVFWSVYQNISEILSGADRHVGGMNITQGELSESLLCQEFGVVAGAWNSIKGVFDDERYICQASGHVIGAFDIISNYARKKGALGILPESVSIGETSYPINKSLWSGYYSPPAEQDSSMGIASRATIGVIESIWSASNFINGEGGVLMGTEAMDRSLLSGDAPIMFDMSGKTSPFVLLNRLGDNTRTLATVLYGLYKIGDAFSTLSGKSVDARIQTMSHVTFGASTFGSPLLEMPMYLVSSVLRDGMNTLFGLAGTLFVTSLIIAYGIPLIPIIGWVFILISIMYTLITAVGAINFGAILLGLPKGEGVFAPDTERLLSLLFGVFIRQPLIVVGFVAHLVLAYMGLSLLNVVWLGAFANKLSGSGLFDSIISVIVFFLGYCIAAFYICIYSFRVVSAITDSIGVWFSTHLTGGVFGNNHEDYAAAQQGIVQLSKSLDDVGGMLKSEMNRRNNPTSSDGGKPKADGAAESKASSQTRYNA